MENVNQPKYLTTCKTCGFLKGSIQTTLVMLQELGKSKFVPIVVNCFSALSCHSNFSPVASLVTF